MRDGIRLAGDCNRYSTQAGPQCIRKLSASERGIYAASLSLLPELSLSSKLADSFTLKRPEGRAPTNRQLLDAPRTPRRYLRFWAAPQWNLNQQSPMRTRIL